MLDTTDLSSSSALPDWQGLSTQDPGILWAYGHIRRPHTRQPVNRPQAHLGHTRNSLIDTLETPVPWHTLETTACQNTLYMTFHQNTLETTACRNTLEMPVHKKNYEVVLVYKRLLLHWKGEHRQSYWYLYQLTSILLDATKDLPILWAQACPPGSRNYSSKHQHTRNCISVEV